jgi:Skp family chaperone for outer membrane proteins
MKNMRKLLKTLVLVSVLVAGGARAADEIAFVDLQEVFKRFYKTQLAQDQIRQQADDIKMEREEIEDEVKVMKEEIEVLRTDSRDETLSDEIRENKRNQLEEKLVELQKKEQDMNDFEKLRMQQMEQQNTRMTKKLFDEIHDSVINYAKAQGFSAVIDRSAQSRIGTDAILFVSPKLDITSDVLAVMNEGREGTREAEPEFKVEEKKVEE